MRNTIRKIIYKTTRQERSFGKVDIERKESCGTWRVFYDLGEEINPRPDFGEVELYTRRGGILCLVIIPLCPSYSWFSIMIILLVSQFRWDVWIYVAHALFGSLIQSFRGYYFYVVDTWATLTTCSYILLAKLHNITIEFTFMIHKVLVEILIYMHGSIYCGTWKELVKYMVMLYVAQICVRGVPPRSRVILIDDGYKVEKRYMHVSCQFHKLLMPLHATWCSLKFPAICPPVVKYF